MHWYLVLLVCTNKFVNKRTFEKNVKRFMKHSVLFNVNIWYINKKGTLWKKLNIFSGVSHLNVTSLEKFIHSVKKEVPTRLNTKNITKIWWNRNMITESVNFLLELHKIIIYFCFVFKRDNVKLKSIFILNTEKHAFQINRHIVQFFFSTLSYNFTVVTKKFPPRIVYDHPIVIFHCFFIKIIICLRKFKLLYFINKYTNKTDTKLQHWCTTCKDGK